MIDSIFNPSGSEFSDGETYCIGYESAEGEYSKYNVFRLTENAENFAFLGAILSRTDEDEEVRLRVEILVGITDYADAVDELNNYDPD